MVNVGNQSGAMVHDSIRLFAKQILAFFLLMCIFLSAARSQTPAVIPLSSEPHHHLALHNEYVNLYQVEVAPHDTVGLHRHDFDAISVMLSDSEVTVRAPGKPDVHQTLSKGQIRLQPRGYVHSTTIEGNTTYHNVTIELLLPQQEARNLCAPVIASQPLNCPNDRGSPPSATHSELPQFETDQTSVSLTRVLPHQSLTLSGLARPQLIVLLDSLSVLPQEKDQPVSQLHPGDFVWLARNKTGQVFKNESDREVRLVSFVLKSP
jgi:quercetin dioxygenase-like cupin family protein